MQFLLTDGQKKRFNEFFRSLYTEQTGMMGVDFASFIFRMGINVYRIAMLLSLMRRYSDCMLPGVMFPQGEQALVCKDVDFETSLTIIDCLVSHTADMVTTLVPQDKKAAARMAKAQQPLTTKELAVLKSLSDEFLVSDLLAVAEALQIGKRTAYRMLQSFINERHIVERVCHGKYMKIKKEEN